jgi:hypothetical protein
MRKNNILKSISFVLLLALIIFIFWKDKGSVTAKFLQITSWSFFYYHLFKKEYIGLLVHSMFVFLILVLAEFLQFSGDVTTSAYSALVFSLSFCYIMTNRLLPTFKLGLKILYGFFSSIILIIPLSFMLFQLQFGSTVSKEVLYAFFQTNHKEGVEYVNEFISLEFICLLISILFISWAFIALQSSGAKKVRWSALLFIASICYFSLSPALAVFDIFWESAITYKTELTSTL